MPHYTWLLEEKDERFTLDNVNEMYIDVLREIGNIGAEECNNFSGKHDQ